MPFTVPENGDRSKQFGVPVEVGYDVGADSVVNEDVLGMIEMGSVISVVGEFDAVEVEIVELLPVAWDVPDEVEDITIAADVVLLDARFATFPVEEFELG